MKAHLMKTADSTSESYQKPPFTSAKTHFLPTKIDLRKLTTQYLHLDFDAQNATCQEARSGDKMEEGYKNDSFGIRK
jgi:hypothetical protein